MNCIHVLDCMFRCRFEAHSNAQSKEPRRVTTIIRWKMVVVVVQNTSSLVETSNFRLVVVVVVILNYAHCFKLKFLLNK